MPGNTRDNSTYLFVLPWSIELLGGVNEVVRNLYREFFRDSSFDPAILMSGWSCSGTGSDGEFMVFSVPLRTPWDPKHRFRSLASFILHQPALLWLLNRVVREKRIRVINPHFPGLYCLQFVLLKRFALFRGEILLSFHGSDVKGMCRTRGVEAWLWRRLLRSADRVVVVSEQMRREIVEFDSEVKPFTVWNGIDCRSLLAGSASSVVPLAGQKYVLSIGSYNPAKGHDLLIEAFQQVHSYDKTLKLVLLENTLSRSADSSGATLQQMVRARNLDDSVVIFEDVPRHEIGAWLKFAELFVLPSRSEGFGIVVLEAAACGTTVISTRVGIVPELITDDVNGRVVPCDDASALAEAIIELLKDDLKRNRLGASLRDRVSAEFTWEAACKKYLQLLRI